MMFRILTALMGILLFVSSCKKEKSLEQGLPARGSLQDNGGDCLPKKVNGAYVVGQALNDSNYIEVSVEVSQAGNFTIFTDTLNGYSYKGEGQFATPGAYIVRIPGRGTPEAEGEDQFTVFFDTTLCFLPVTVIAGGSSGGTAGYNLQGDAGGGCAASDTAGTFTQGIPLTTSNSVNLTVNVTTPGTWAISTPSVAGFSFSGAGTFAAAGVQTVTLTASGTPTLPGTHTFTVTAGTSCSFDVAVGAGTNPPPTGVYFPLTEASWWSYDDGAGSDTFKVAVTGTGTFLGKTYQRFITSDAAGPLDTTFYRKDASNSYYIFEDTAGFGDAGITFTQGGLDVLFLKDALTTNAVFNSDHTATFQGSPITIRFKNTVTDANASLTVNGKSFTNVYKIQVIIQGGLGGNFQDLTDPLDYYYARDIGLIRISDGVTSQDIRNWKVN
jgi:hypothetical protein